jgi:hypothetical protein
MTHRTAKGPGTLLSPVRLPYGLTIFNRQGKEHATC